MDSIHLSCFDLLRDVVRVDLMTFFQHFMEKIFASRFTNLQDTVFSALLFAQHFQSVLIVSRSDDTIRDFPRNDLRSGKITRRGEGNEVSK